MADDPPPKPLAPGQSRITCPLESMGHVLRLEIGLTEEQWRRIWPKQSKFPDIVPLYRFLREQIKVLEDSPKAVRSYLRKLQRDSKAFPEPARSLTRNYVASILDEVGRTPDLDKESVRRHVKETQAWVHRVRLELESQEKEAIGQRLPPAASIMRRRASARRFTSDRMPQWLGPDKTAAKIHLRTNQITELVISFKKIDHSVAVEIVSLLTGVPKNTIRQYAPPDTKSR